MCSAWMQCRSNLLMFLALAHKGLFVNNNPSVTKQTSSKTKQAMLLLGFIGFTAGILWSVSGRATSVEHPTAEVSIEPETASEESKDTSQSRWLAFMPKTSVEKRDSVRSARQDELAEMIRNFSGVKKATVLLSDDQKQGIGQPNRRMTACVMVEPTAETIPSETIVAIRTIVADATSGLFTENVDVINSKLGALATGKPSAVRTKYQASQIRTDIERALGLTMASISVRLQRENDVTEYIPWIDESTPFVRVSLPQSWLQKRSEQVGDKALVLNSLEAMVREVAPRAEITISVVEDQATVVPLANSKEYYVKQVALFVGVFLILGAGLLPERRRREQETVYCSLADSPKEEAEKILQMEHFLARKAIDSLEGVRKVEVLRAIIASDVPDVPEELPVVEVKTGTQLELTNCG